jgi:alkyl hydroperoxide reductase subunit AhpC
LANHLPDGIAALPGISPGLAGCGTILNCKASKSIIAKRGVELLGLSIDSVYSHIAWMRNMEEKIGVQIPFPIIADLN